MFNLIKLGLEDFFDISVKVAGNGIRGQADAIKLGVATSLNSINKWKRGCPWYGDAPPCPNLWLGDPRPGASKRGRPSKPVPPGPPKKCESDLHSKAGLSFISTAGIGRHKRSVAKVSLNLGTGSLIVNGRTVESYFQFNSHYINSAKAPLIKLGLEDFFDISVKVAGGGIRGQADAIKLGVAKSLNSIGK